MNRKNGDRDEKALQAVGIRQAAPQDPEGVGSYPTLCECLYPRFKEGKCIREPGRISVKPLGGYYVVTVSCPSEGVQTTVTLGSLRDLLTALESHLSNPATVWLPDYESQKKARLEARK